MPIGLLRPKPGLTCGYVAPKQNGKWWPTASICQGHSRTPAGTRRQTGCVWHAARKAHLYRQHRLRRHVAQPRHDETDTSKEEGNSDWDRTSEGTEEGVSDTTSAIDWPKLQSIAATAGGLVLALVLAITVAGTTDLPLEFYNSLPDDIQKQIPTKAQLGIQKDTGQVDVAALVQNAVVSVLTLTKLWRKVLCLHALARR